MPVELPNCLNNHDLLQNKEVSPAAPFWLARKENRVSSSGRGCIELRNILIELLYNNFIDKHPAWVACTRMPFGAGAGVLGAYFNISGIDPL